MTVAATKVSVRAKIKELQKHLQSVSRTHSATYEEITEDPTSSSDLNSQAQKQDVSDLEKVLNIVFKNFIDYTTKAADRLNMDAFRPQAEQKLIHSHFAANKKVQLLTEYLGAELLNFAKNTLRFMPTVKNSDYHLDIFVGGRRNNNVRIGFKNSKGKQTGPFLKTHVITSPFTGCDMLVVNIGYIDKHKKPIFTHVFDYDILENIDLMAEKHGKTTHLKTNTQITHDKYIKNSMKSTQEHLQQKFER